MGIAKALAEAGAELAFSYQGEAFGKRLEPLAGSVGSKLLFDMDVTDDASLERGFHDLSKAWETMDFVVHAIAFSDKSELTGRFIDTSRANFKHSLDISAYSFIEVARRAHPMMRENGGSLMTLTFQGSQRVTPFYNVMGVAKAALESTTRYLANDLGPEGIRVNAISPGPMKTLAGAAIGGARKTYKFTDQNAPYNPMPRWKRLGERPSTLPQTLPPVPQEKLSTWTADFMSWACHGSKIFKVAYCDPNA